MPDIAGWRRERLSRMPADQRFEIVSDWVREVLSPTTASTDRERKMRVDAGHGVACAWLVDPTAQRVEASMMAEGDWQPLATAAGATSIRAAPFSDVDIPPPWG